MKDIPYVYRFEKQQELSDSLIEDIVPQDYDLFKLKKVINWENTNRIEIPKFLAA